LVGAGVRTGWEERLAELGVIEMGDGLAVHPYNYQVTNDLAPEHCIQKLVELEARLRAKTKRSSIDLYVTEIGWPTNVGRYGVSEDVARKFATRLVVLANSLPYLKGIWWYDLIDDGQDPHNKEHHFGLFRVDMTPKPAAKGIAAATAFVSTHDLKLSTTEGLDDGAIAIEARPLVGPAQEVVVWDARQIGRLRIDCTAQGDVRAIKQTYGAAAVSATPVSIFARGGRCVLRPVDPT
jgi:polysaccharide biosynthesis protein PslG